MRIRTASLLFGVLIFGLFAMLGFSLVRTTNLLESEARDLAMAGESISAARRLKLELLIHNRNVFFHSVRKDQARPETAGDLRKEITDILATVRRLINNEAAATALVDLEEDITAYLENLSRLEASGLSAIEQYNILSKHVDEILPMVDQLIGANEAQMDALVESIQRQNKATDRVGLLILVMGGVLLLSLTAMIFCFVTYPLRDIARTISDFSAGNAATRVKPGGIMEICQIGSNFNSMADRMEEKQREQLRFIASIAHDLRNPLSSMMMASELLRHKDDTKSRNLTATILRQVKNLDRMVGDLLDTARIEAGHLDLKFERFNINSVIEDSVNLYNMPGADLHLFRLELPDGPLLCECDGARISQVMNNLLSNAVKYSPNGGIVTVSARTAGHEIVISIADEGIGIAREELDLIFRPFNRTQATRDTIHGIGLGLSASRRIVEGHGGKLWVESTPGAGSTFYFSLPLKQGGGMHAPGDPRPAKGMAN
jgi:signal transduction histidine kinase